MLSMLRNWLAGKLGCHVCDEFTRWETIKGEDPATVYSVGGVATCRKVRWQERTCTICGKVYVRFIDGNNQ